ncbi:MAG: hypothetical protein HOE76_06920 [Euryarchaeota archaeon]|jgi:hypothetical protein|nr:hypothetical protein [Euryarchaeota archaeon]MBT4982008.1 hypothetical protein [Euryarchaeota archaeon]MBT5184972.1 hypothetical protein [Euryarchaeota archaeon]
MGETLATLAFLSAIAMLLSTTTSYGKWLASLTGAFCSLEFLQSPFESIQQPGGSALLVAASMSFLLQYHITKDVSQKTLNGIGGSIILIILLSMFPEDGLQGTIHDYSVFENIRELVISLSIGLLIAQLIVNALSFNKKLSLIIALMVFILVIFGELMQRTPLTIILTSCMMIGYLPILEEKINNRIGSGRGRAIALGVPVLLGIILIFATTYVSITSVSRIGSGDGAIAVALWLTLGATGIGLIGMLLPLLGLDAHPRPEAWGWRYCLALSPIVMALQTDLSGHVLLGIFLAIIISISAPLVLESNPAKGA